MPGEVVVDSTDRLADVLAARMEERARAAMSSRGFFALALPGGSVGERFFARLARAAVDWTRTEFFWGDERAVPPDHPDSNFLLAHSKWLEPARVPPARIHRMPADADNLPRAATAYEAEMARVLGTPPRLDLALLGVGPDGHVCSLFPGHPLLAEKQRWVRAIEDSPKPPARRLTLTLPALGAASLVVVAALGAAKAEVMRAAIEDADSELPVALVARRGTPVLFLLDPEAASLLRGR